MKHLIFLFVCTAAAGFGSLVNPFWGVMLYYGLAVLRPQDLWDWSLPITLRWSLMAAIIIFVGVLFNGSRVLRDARSNSAILLMGAFAALLAISCLMAYQPGLAFQWGTETWKVLLIAVVASFIIRDLSQVRLLLLLVLGILGYLAWQVNSLYFFDGRVDIYHYGFAGFDNNGAALMLAMGLPLAYAVATGWKNKWVRLACGFAAVCIIHAIMLSYSRGAMLASLAVMGALLLLHRPRWQAGVAAAVLVIVVSILAGNEVRDRFHSTFHLQNNESAQSRFQSWQAAWEIACEHPFFGKGVRNSATYSYNYGTDIVGRGIHSQYLQIAADAGIPALLVYLALLVLALRNFSRSRAMCLDFVEHCGDRAPPKAVAELSTIAELSRGAQGSLAVFVFGSIFLSMESFELPWFLIAVGGMLPHLVVQRIETTLNSDAQPETDAHADAERFAARHKPDTHADKPRPADLWLTPPIQKGVPQT